MSFLLCCKVETEFGTAQDSASLAEHFGVWLKRE